MNGKDIALTTLNQLGGKKFIAMTGAKNISYDSDGTLRFRIGRNAKSINAVCITLTPMDTYTMEFFRVRNLEITLVGEYTNVYADNLQEVFTSATGMYTSF